MVRVLILYYSRGGNVEALAKAVAQGVEKVEGATTELKRVDYATVEDLISCDAVAFGSPNYFGYMAGLLKDFFDRAWSIREKIAGKPAAAFTCGGSSSDSVAEHREDFLSFQNGEGCCRRCLGSGRRGLLLEKTCLS
ncbi:MAG: NAD(P)H-dependent oxidoreductase [Candidatus Brockarchaeota archaeon]|nr:NAD(P)H-dependent oxidoreductase [Candidatus Brockarchaeota archaeon]